MNIPTDRKSKIEFGRKLKEAREKRNLTQAEVAKMVGYNANYYARIERGDGNPPLSKIIKMTNTLGIK